MRKWLVSHARMTGLVVLVCACALYAATFVSYATVRASLDGMMPDGNAWFATHCRFGYLVTLLRVLAGGLILLGGGAVLVGRHFDTVMRRLALDLSNGWADFRAMLSGACRPAERFHLAALGVVVIVAGAIRWVFLFQPITYDEAWTYMNFAAWPLDYALSWYQFPNNHLFHTLWVHLGTALLGNEPWVLRLPALTAGLVLLPAGYVVFRGIFGSAPALMAAGLLASSTALVRYSTCARGYTLLALACVLCLGLGYYALTRRNCLAGLFGAVAAALGFYTLPLMVLPFGTVILWLFCVNMQGQPRRNTLENLAGIAICGVLTVVVTVLLYLPVFLEAGVNAVIDNRFMAPLSWVAFRGALPGVVPELWAYCNEEFPVALRIILAAGFVVGVIGHWRIGAPLVASAFLCTAGVMIVQRVLPENRMWIWVVPLYCAVAAAGIWRVLIVFIRTPLSRGAVSGLLGLGLCVVLAIRLVAQHPDRRLWDAEPGTFGDAEAITDWIKKRFAKDVPVVVGHPECVPLAYHFLKNDMPVSGFRSYASEIGQSLKRNGVRRILVVVGPTSTLDETLADVGIGTNTFRDVNIIQRYPSGAVYLLSCPDDREAAASSAAGGSP